MSHRQAQRFGRGVLAMLKGGVRSQVTERAVAPARSRSASSMAELFAPLDRLLSAGGDARLTINPASGLNEYGCQPYPCPDTLSFSSSTATSISQRAYDRAQKAREALMQSAIAAGIEAAFDSRMEAMRDELRAALGLPRTSVDVVFSPSGTDSQLQALFLARARFGSALTTVVVAADQTGSGTVNTARGCHFSAERRMETGFKRESRSPGLPIPSKTSRCGCSMRQAKPARTLQAIPWLSGLSNVRSPTEARCSFK